MKTMRKTLLYLNLICLTLVSAFGVSFISHASTTMDKNTIVSQEAVYDLTIGGTQEFDIVDAKGNNAIITISEDTPLTKVDNGTYKVSYTSNGCWKASYRIVISNNSITSVHSPEYAAITGVIRQNKLIKENSKQASYYLFYQINAYSINTGVRSRISSTDLKVSVI